MKTKILSLLTVLLLSAATGFGQTSGQTGTLTWTLENGTLTISGTGAMPNYSAPDYAPWYSDRPSITSVIIEDGVTSIGDDAFSNCSNLASVTIPNSVTIIGNYAFADCYSLASVTIPESVTSIGERTFSGTAWLSNQTDGVVYAGKVLYCYKGTMPQNEHIEIREGTLGIADGAFFACISLTSVTIPNSVTSIGTWAFFACRSLTSVTIPNSVTSIGGYAFFFCQSLASVTIPESVTSIGVDAFSITAWLYNQTDGVVYAGKVLYCYKGTMPQNEHIEIREGTLGIADGAFYQCSSLASVTIPESVTSIGYSAFYDCRSLTSVTIPNSVTSIGGGAFSGCSNLASVTIPNSVTSIGYGAFSSCSKLTSVTIGNSVTSIESGTFSNCHSLVSITIPNGVTELRDGAFQSCSGLTSITISESVTSIGYYAFAYCNLTSITNLNPEPQEINSDVFLGLMLSNITLYVPAESLDAYGAAGIWKDFGTITAYIPDAINAPSAANAVRAYFDPATGSIRIEGLTAPAQVTVINMGGKTILQQTVAGDGNIPTGHLPRGVYLVNVNGQTVKIIK